MFKISEQHTIFRKTRFVVMVFGILAVVASQSFAEVKILYGNVILYNEPPNAYELAKMLFPSKTRTIELDQETKSTLDTPVSVAFKVNFKYDSTIVENDSIPYLDALGDMLNFAQLKGKSLKIEGHADASGDAYYNLQLSEARAKAIKQYLHSVHRIDENRLYTKGYGETHLLDNSKPYAQINRRAEFSPWESSIN